MKKHILLMLSLFSTAIVAEDKNSKETIQLEYKVEAQTPHSKDLQNLNEELSQLESEALEMTIKLEKALSEAKQKKQENEKKSSNLQKTLEEKKLASEIGSEKNISDK